MLSNILPPDGPRPAGRPGAIFAMEGGIEKESEDALVPAGTYAPFFRDAGEKHRPVPALKIDRYPVTKGERAAFVAVHPEWGNGIFLLDARGEVVAKLEGLGGEQKAFLDALHKVTAAP